MDLDDDPELKAAGGMPNYGPNGSVNGGSYAAVGGNSSNHDPSRRTDSPLPAPQPQRPLPRHSLEGETIFAVGDDDRDLDSDDDDDTKEDKRLRGKAD